MPLCCGHVTHLPKYALHVSILPYRANRLLEPKETMCQGVNIKTTALLRSEGWTVLRFWEHEDPVEAAARIGCGAPGYAFLTCSAGRDHT